MDAHHPGESPVLLPNLQILLWLSQGAAPSFGDYQALQQLSAGRDGLFKELTAL